MKFTEFLIGKEQLTEAPPLFGRFKRKQPTPQPPAPPTATDPDESSRRRFLRRLDESYRVIARLASHAYDADIDAETLIEELTETVNEMYERKEQRAERKKRSSFRGEEDAS